jgi:hypothetical protein
VIEDVHVYPVDDLIAHCLKGFFCQCNPTVEKQENGALLIIHNSWHDIFFGELLDERLTETSTGMTAQ